MVEGSTRRLPTWSVVVDEDKRTNKKKKEKKVSTSPRNSLSLANNGTEKAHDKLPPAPRGGNKRKAKKTVTDDEDESLTVEDLVTIAREYVKNNNHSEQNLALSRTCEPSSSGEQRLPSGEPTALNLTSELSLVNFSRTGDATQDMLHLFLGPLLKKPQDDEQRTQFDSKHMDLACELVKQQSPNHFREEIIPKTKNKSSLKDKVSLLLDRI